MKKTLLLLLSFIVICHTFSQKANVTWGDEFKLKKGSTDLSVLCADNSGVFLQESHDVLKSYFFFGATTRTSASLVKLDKNLAELYRNDFNKCKDINLFVETKF